MPGAGLRSGVLAPGFVLCGGWCGWVSCCVEGSNRRAPGLWMIRFSNAERHVVCPSGGGFSAGRRAVWALVGCPVVLLPVPGQVGEIAPVRLVG